MFGIFLTSIVVTVGIAIGLLISFFIVCAVGALFN